MDRRDNPLKNAPHTAAAVLGGGVEARLRARAGGLSAARAARQAKYWPPVGRADNVYGDRNLFCACVPVEAFV